MKKNESYLETKGEKPKLLEEWLGECLKKSRKLRGVTQKQLAEAIGISQSAYASYENGYRRCPATVLIKVSQYLKMPVEFMLDQTIELPYESNPSYKDLESLIYEIPLEDLEIFLEALEIQISQGLTLGESEMPAIKWAGKGLDIAKTVNKRGQDMIEQFINSIMSNPLMLKQ